MNRVRGTYVGTGSRFIPYRELIVPSPMQPLGQFRLRARWEDVSKNKFKCRDMKCSPYLPNHDPNCYYWGVWARAAAEVARRQLERHIKAEIGLVRYAESIQEESRRREMGLKDGVPDRHQCNSNIYPDCCDPGERSFFEVLDEIDVELAEANKGEDCFMGNQRETVCKECGKQLTPDGDHYAGEGCDDGLF